MRRSYVIVGIAAAFLGFGWRLDNAEKTRKMENVEIVSAEYAAQRAGTKDFFVMNLRPDAGTEGITANGEAAFTLEALNRPDARELLSRAGITSDAEIVLKGGSPEETAAAAKRLLTLLNWNSTVVKQLVPVEE